MLAMTTDFHGQSKNTAEIRDTLAKIARAGFSHIHWCHEWTGDYLYSVHEMHQIREWCDELGLKTKGVHASLGLKPQPNDAPPPLDTYQRTMKYYVSMNEYNRRAGVELVENRIELARILDAEAIVLHLDQPLQAFAADLNYREQFYGQAFKSFDELEPYCKDRGIRLCIENTSIPPAYSIIQFDILFRRYDSSFMGICLDTGHANIACKENCVEYAERYHDRLFMIHCHDNQGKEDEHILPFRGSFDWDAFARALARSPYEFPLVLEPSFKEPKEKDDAPWLEEALRAGNRLQDMVMKYRAGNAPV